MDCEAGPKVAEEDAWAKRLDYARLPLDLSRHVFESVRNAIIYYAGAEYERSGHRPFVALTPAQFNALAAERTAHEDRPALPELRARFAAGIDAAVAYLRTVPEASLLIPREVGRKRLPSTTLGLIFHAAEHSSRHAGQIVTLNQLVRGA